MTRKIGKDAVVIGDVIGDVGDGSVVIGATQQNGCVNLNQSMTIGRGAVGGPNSIVIGANANAGTPLSLQTALIRELNIALANQDLLAEDGLAEQLEIIKKEVEAPDPSTDRIDSAIKYLSAADKTIGIFEKYPSIVKVLKMIVGGFGA